MSAIKKIRTTIIVLLLDVALLPQLLYAVPLTSPNYKLDPQGMNAVGGQGSSASYRMISSGGEAVVGNGSSGSYKLSSGYTGALQQSIELSLSENGTAGYYPFDTNIGIQAYDATANSSNGELINGAGWTGGKIGSALSLDGVNDYVNLRAPANLGITGDLTISAWVNPTDFATGNELISWGNGASAYPFRVIIFTNGRTRFICTGCTTRTGGTPITAGVWSHIAVTISGSTIKFYTNGVLESTQDLGISTRPSSDGLLYIGRQSGTYFKGGIDELKLYNRTLSDDEIRNTYDANTAGITGAVTIPQVTPGVPQTVGMDMTVITDAGGYDAAISQNNNLTHSDTATTIAALAGGSIASPVLWDDGTTKGLGFTITGGLSVPAKWGSGPVNYKYAALPGSATTFFSRTGLSGGQKEVTNLQFKLDVPTSQKSGQYSNIATVTATLKP